MNILAIETSSEYASVALLSGDETQCFSLEGHANHSERLLPAVSRLLAEAQLTLTALDAVAFGAGPGAFTGLRLACGVAQGLAMGAGLGVVPVCSLAALSMRASASLVLVAADARMGEVYCAAYHLQNGFPETIQEPLCMPPSQLRLIAPGDWFAIGSALRVYDIDLACDSQTRLVGIDAEAYPRAEEIARIAAHEVLCGHVIAPEQAAPLYIRNKVALTKEEQAARKKRA